MKTDDLDVETIKQYWIARERKVVADQTPLEKGDYSYALFFGHPAIEKLLKGLFVDRQHEHAPRLHSLPRLARLAGLNLDKARQDTLIVISRSILKRGIRT